MSDDRSNDGKPLAYGEFVPKLTPDDTDGKPTVLTIAKTRRQNVAPASSKREEWKIILRFAESFSGETPDEQRREYIVNATAYKTLCSKMGTDDEKRWVGKQVVMAPTTTNFEGEGFEKMHVATPERWEKVMEAAKGGAKSGAATKKTPSRR